MFPPPIHAFEIEGCELAVRTMTGAVVKGMLKIACPERTWERIRKVWWRIWDRWHGVETCDLPDVSALTVVGRNRTTAAHYEPSGDIRSILKDLRIDYERYAFVDFGSGKGRVLLQAARFPFRSVEGVEFSVELHRIAERNIRQYRRAKVRCRQVKTILADAAGFRLPSVPLVLYFFNPFSGPVLASVVENIQRSAVAEPRDILIICVGTYMPKEACERISGAQVVWRRGDSTVYRVPESA
jgi:SAM-dependent methyltransferase